MKLASLTLLVILGLCFYAEATDIKAITTKPTAGNPQFGDRTVWPDLHGDEYFQRQKWEKSRVLIWDVARSLEKGAGKRNSKVDGSDPANWIDAATGKAAASLPDMQTDIILPDSDVPYTASLRHPDVRSVFCRHVTIGRNAALDPLYARGGFQIAGNLWIRPGGAIKTGMWTLMFIGDKHTFVRNDWPEDGVLEKLHKERQITPYEKKDIRKQPWWNNLIATYTRHAKTDGGSTEVVGFVAFADEVGIQSGTFIVGRDSRFITLGPSSIDVGKGATLALMDGSHCSHGMNQLMRDWRVSAGGKLTGGTPDRPLKRDAFMGMGYGNWMNLPVPEPENQNKKKEPRLTPDGSVMQYGYGGYSTLVQGDLIGCPAPGSSARLVVCWQRMRGGGAGAWGRKDEAFKEFFPTIEPKIQLWISPESKIENVRFDNLSRGGIVTDNIQTFEKWENVSFGSDCLSKDPKEIIRSYLEEAEKLKQRDPGAKIPHPTSPLDPEKKYTTM